jgi:hypothetical protein
MAVEFSGSVLPRNTRTAAAEKTNPESNIFWLFSKS